MSRRCFNTFAKTVLLIMILTGITSAEAIFKAVLIDGTAKIQRSSTRLWQTLTLGDRVESNDIIETFYQSKTALQYGTGNIILLGPNTKVLLTIKEDDDKKQRLTLTVFSGGLLLKAQGNSSAEIFTANAVAKVDTAVFSTVVEAKTGNTGFQVLNGAATARNISQQVSKPLGKGLTTIVLPGKEPTPPLYITYRHVAVLRHFFGDDLVKREIDAAGLTPTEDAGSTNRLSMANNLSAQEALNENQMYKRLFSADKIYGSLIKSSADSTTGYQSSIVSKRPFSNRFEVGIEGGGALAAGGYHHMEVLSLSVHGPKAAFGIRVPFSSDATRPFAVHINSLAGFLDKIDYLDLGAEGGSRTLHFGSLDNYTLGRGLLVNRFSARNLQSVTRPLSAALDLSGNNATWKLFLADMAMPSMGGTHLLIQPGMSWISAGYVFDANQKATSLQPQNSRFDTIPSGTLVEKPADSIKLSAHTWEVGAGFAASPTNDLSIGVDFQYAQKFSSRGSVGWMIRGPEFEIEYTRFKLSLSYVLERGSIHEGYFGTDYMTTRRQITRISKDTVWYETPDNILSPMRRAAGVILAAGFTPKTGSSINFSFRQDFVGLYPFMTDNRSDTAQNIDTTNNKNNFSWHLTAAIDKRLVPGFTYAKIHVSQNNGALYPRGGRYFASWGFRAGLDFLTKPLVLNTALEGGVLFSYLDLFKGDGTQGFNNNIDAGDNMFEFRLGLRWGYK